MKWLASYSFSVKGIFFVGGCEIFDSRLTQGLGDVE